MNAKTKNYLSITDPRPNFPSGNYSVSNTVSISGENSFKELLKQGAITSIGSNQWFEITKALARGYSPSVAMQRFVGSESVGVISFYSEDVLESTNINMALGVSNHSFREAAVNTSDKQEFFRLLSEQGVLLPFWRATNRGIDGIREILSEYDGISSEVIVKPASGTGSIGVYRGSIENEDAFINELSVAVKGMSSESNLIFMEAVTREQRPFEIAINVIVRQGKIVFLTIHDKISQSDTAPFRDFMMVTPSNFNGFSEQQTESLVSQVIDATSMRDGVLQLEARIRQDGTLIPIDSAPRPDGGLIPESIYAAYNIDIRLVHTYMQLGLLSEVDRLVSGASRNPSAAALGAFYADNARLNEKGLDLLDVYQHLHKLEDAIDYHIMQQTTNLGSINNEVAVAMCVKGKNRDDALYLLRAYAEVVGLLSGEAYLSLT